MSIAVDGKLKTVTVVGEHSNQDIYRFCKEWNCKYDNMMYQPPMENLTATYIQQADRIDSDDLKYGWVIIYKEEVMPKYTPTIDTIETQSGKVIVKSPTDSILIIEVHDNSGILVDTLEYVGSVEMKKPYRNVLAEKEKK